MLLIWIYCIGISYCIKEVYLLSVSIELEKEQLIKSEHNKIN